MWQASHKKLPLPQLLASMMYKLWASRTWKKLIAKLCQDKEQMAQERMRGG